MRPHDLLALIDFSDVMIAGSAPAIDVMKGVIPHFMSVIEEALKHVRVLANVIANAKKCSFNVCRPKRLKDKFGRTGNGTIIKGEE